MEKGGSRARPAIEDEYERAGTSWALRNNIGSVKNARGAFAVLTKDVPAVAV